MSLFFHFVYQTNFEYSIVPLIIKINEPDDSAELSTRSVGSVSVPVKKNKKGMVCVF